MIRFKNVQFWRTITLPDVVGVIGSVSSGDGDGGGYEILWDGTSPMFSIAKAGWRAWQPVGNIATSREDIEWQMAEKPFKPDHDRPFLNAVEKLPTTQTFPDAMARAEASINASEVIMSPQQMASFRQQLATTRLQDVAVAKMQLAIAAAQHKKLKG